ncbi:MAG: alpha/beta fold hydrolase [Hoeflea sp.]|uniref:alpha/beta fold hydrolase n=1 Tax=Hoeflea sp. TaxID=1940281 RepID=UPI0032EFE98A
MSVVEIATWILRLALASAAIYLAIATALVLSQFPSPPPAGKTLDFSALSGRAGNAEGSGAEAAPLQFYQARDGARLGFRRYEAAADTTIEGPGESAAAPLLVFIHGSGWHGAAYDGLARRLAATGKLTVLLPDLRGHGPTPRTRGDIAYIGQFEDDIADLVALQRKAGQKLLIGGHSSGGGLAVRYAGGDHGAGLDGAVLVAPFLKHDSPAMRPGSGGWANPLTRRIIGLSMLNAVGITALNNMTAIQFRFPQHVLEGPQGSSATPAYSFRLNTSFAPRADFLADIAALPPFLLIAGRDDEAFIPEAYEPTMHPVNPKGRYLLVEDRSHLGIIDAPETASGILAFVETGLR